MRGLFGRGAFTAADAHAAALTLMAYAIGLLPFVLMRSVTATFLARGDTTTPVKALFVAVAVNVLLKILLMDRYAQVGLAFATSVGAWINLALLVWFSARQNFLVIDPRLRRSTAKFAIAGAILGAALLLGERPVAGAVRRLDVVARRDDPACACRGRGDHLWHRHSGPVSPGMADSDPGPLISGRDASGTATPS